MRESHAPICPLEIRASVTRVVLNCCFATRDRRRHVMSASRGFFQATRERLRNEILEIMDYADCKSRHRAIINMYLANALRQLRLASCVSLRTAITEGLAARRKPTRGGNTHLAQTRINNENGMCRFNRCQNPISLKRKLIFGVEVKSRARACEELIIASNSLRPGKDKTR